MTSAQAVASTDCVTLLIATRKGAWTLTSDTSRCNWTIEGPHLLGNIVNHFVLDPRDGQTMLLSARTGHLGPTVFRSEDKGRTWQEAAKPPAFTRPVPTDGSERAGQRRKFEPLAGADENTHTDISPRAVDHVFWLAPGHAEERNVWYAGSSPQGLFRSDDGGSSWEPVAGFNDHPNWVDWTQDGQDQTPDGAVLHSILVDPRDGRHMYVGCSGGGVFESRDAGLDWRPLNRGSVADFGPDPTGEYGQHPHCMRYHPLDPDILYQQNHCGIYRMQRPSDEWRRIGDNMPKEIGDVGFPIALHPRDPETVWVFPMDATDVWPRTCPDGRPAVYRTRDSGASWQRMDAGLPAEQAWFTVLRQAMSVDQHDPAGIYFGTTTGELWGSTDEGETWRCLVSHLPHIYSVEAVELSS